MQAAAEAEVLQIERKALDRCLAGDAAGFAEFCAEDVTYFDPLTRARIDGHKALQVYLEAQHEEAKSRYELLNPQVASVGPVQLLTYNLVLYREGTDGKEELDSNWNCSEVYRKEAEGWRIIHSHWSYTAHEAFREPPAEGEAGA